MLHKLKKYLPITLMAWPYFIIVLLKLPDNQSDLFYTTFFIAYMILTVLVYVSNIVNACLYKGENAGYQLAFWNILIKLVHIPFYLIVFSLGILFLLAMVVPALVFFSPIMIMLLTAIDFFLMITSSMYGINAIIRAARKGYLSKKFALLHIILHFFFVTDVISAIIVYIKLKKEKRI